MLCYTGQKAKRRCLSYTPDLPRLEYALESMLCMLSQHHAIELQTDCMVTMLAPVPLRLLDSRVYALWP